MSSSEEQTTGPSMESVRSHSSPEGGTHSPSSEQTDHLADPDSNTAHPSSPIRTEGGGAVSECATATVKLVLMPDARVVTVACPVHCPLQHVKDQLASELRMPVDFIFFIYNGVEVAPKQTLATLGVTANGSVQVEVHSSDPVTHPLAEYRLQTANPLPDIITVRAVSGKGEEKVMVVEIERTECKKPYLGGFRDRLSGVVFHNAKVQTGFTPKVWLRADNASCRDTQTVEQWHQRQQTFNDTSTQMTGINVYVSNMGDKLLKPGKYTTADERAESILKKIIVIQKYYRRWLAIRKVEGLREAKRRWEEWMAQEELRKLRERKDRLQLEFERKMNPRTKQDFDLLYAALEKWRLEELARINDTLSGAERKAALYMLMQQETELLAAIERHKLESGVEELKRTIQNFLNKTAAPKKWRGFDGQPTQMVTPFTLRAKELGDIYDTLNMKYLTQDERLDILLTLKFTVMEYDCALTRDIVELADREADLLMRGVREDHLQGLRKRISTLFLQYVKTPTFNPEAANHIKVPQNPFKLRKNIYFCPSCNKYLPTAEFNLSSNSRTSGNCRRCTRLDNIARPRLDLSHYRRMLEQLRMSEETYKDGSQYAFITQETDIRYLVEYIWNGQSILSAWKDLHDLVLVRWDRQVQWSPWNTIVLTSEEAESHEKVPDLHEAYGEVFHERVQQKHTIAYKYFSTMPGMVQLLSASVIPPSLANGARHLPPGRLNKYTQIPEKVSC